MYRVEGGDAKIVRWPEDLEASFQRYRTEWGNRSRRYKIWMYSHLEELGGDTGVQAREKRRRLEFEHALQWKTYYEPQRVYEQFLLDNDFVYEKIQDYIKDIDNPPAMGQDKLIRRYTHAKGLLDYFQEQGVDVEELRDQLYEQARGSNSLTAYSWQKTRQILSEETEE